VLRFLRSTETGADRRVLAPMYLKEMVYRVLQREQYARLLAVAAAEAANNPVSPVLIISEFRAASASRRVPTATRTRSPASFAPSGTIRSPRHELAEAPMS